MRKSCKWILKLDKNNKENSPTNLCSAKLQLEVADALMRRSALDGSGNENALCTTARTPKGPRLSCKDTRIGE
jgi:hypothetical protein